MTRNQVVNWFAQGMKKRLDENRHKSGWQDMRLAECLRRILEESGELLEAIDQNDPEKTIQECNDIANFAMFAAYNARLSLQKGKS